MKRFAAIILTVGIATIIGGCQQHATAPVSSPLVFTDSVSNVTNNSAIVYGSVLANGASITCYVEYGPTITYGATSQQHAVPENVTTFSLLDTLKNLMPATLYHYRIVGMYEGNVIKGGDQTFTTFAQRDYFPPLTLSETLVFDYFFFRDNRNVPHDPEYEIIATSTWTVTQIQATGSLTTWKLKESTSGIRINYLYYQRHDTSSWQVDTNFEITEDSSHVIKISLWPFWTTQDSGVPLNIPRFHIATQPDSLIFQRSEGATTVSIGLKVNRGIQVCSNRSSAMSNLYLSQYTLRNPP